MRPLLTTGALSFVAGVLIALIAIPRPKPEVREVKVDKIVYVEAKAEATAATTTAEVAPRVEIRRIIQRVRGPEESCAESVEETEVRDAGGTRVIQEATRQATERKEQTHEQTKTVVVDSGGARDWSAAVLLGGDPLHLRDHQWVAGVAVSRHLLGPLGAGGFVLARADSSVEAGLILTWQW